MTELADHHRCRRHGVERVPSKSDPCGAEQQVARPGEITTDDDQGGVQDVDKAADAPTEVEPGVLEAAQSRRVAGLGRRRQSRQAWPRASASTSAPARCSTTHRPPGSHGCRTGTRGPAR